MVALGRGQDLDANGPLLRKAGPFRYQAITTTRRSLPPAGQTFWPAVSPPGFPGTVYGSSPVTGLRQGLFGRPYLLAIS